MSTQNVFFTTPAQIQQLESLSNTNVSFDTAATLRNIGIWARGGPSGAPYYGSIPVLATGVGTSFNALNAALMCPVGGSSNQDAQGLTAPGIAVMIGNAFSNQEVFYSTGVATPYGTGHSYDQAIYGLLSSGKFINSFAFLRLLQERILQITDTAYTCGLTSWTGTYYYYTSGTGVYLNNLTAPVADFTASGNGVGQVWTGTQASASIGTDFSLLNCLSQNIGYVHDLSAYPAGLSQWCYTGATYAGANWAMANAIKDGYLAMIAGKNAGSASGAIAAGNALWSSVVASMCNNKTYVTGPQTDYLTTVINCIKSNATPLGWRVGAMTGAGYGFNLNLSMNAYGTLSYALIGAMCAKAATTRGGYSSLVDYVNQKILQPMEIQLGYDLFFYNTSAPPTATDRYITETVGRRTQLQSSGTCFGSINLFDGGALYQAGLDYVSSAGASGKPFNSMYWSKDYNDSALSLNNVNSVYNDPLGWSFQSSVWCNFKSWSKILRTYINKGVYTNSSNQQVNILSRRLWNYSQATVCSPGSQFYQYGDFPAYMFGYARFIVMQALMFAEDNPYADITFNTADFPGTTNVASNLQATQSSMNKGITWGGVTGTNYFVDLDTGYYVAFSQNMLQSYNVGKALTGPLPLPFIAEN